MADLEKYTLTAEGVLYYWTPKGWFDDATNIAAPRALAAELDRRVAAFTAASDEKLAPTERLDRAKYFREQRDFPRARRLASSLMDDKTHGPAAAAILCSILRRQNQPSQAIEKTQQYASVGYVPLQTSRAAAFCDLGMYSEAVAEIRGIAPSDGGEHLYNVRQRIAAARAQLQG